MSDEDLDTEDALSEDEEIDEVLEMVRPDDTPNHLHYLCRVGAHTELFDRSDLIDGGHHQELVMAFERAHPPPWDTVCSYCDGEGCEECICDLCERRCRHIGGVNYGCMRHPVV
jgi:hypothetical protein